MTSSLKRFRMQTFKDVGLDSDSDSQRPDSIKKRHRRELQEAERENRENTSALMELRDLEDELKSLERLFEAQDAVVRNMKSIFESPDLREDTQNGQMYLEEALSKLEEYKGQTMEMLKRVDTTRNDVSPKSPQTSWTISTTNTMTSTRNYSRWSSARPRSTRSAGLVFRRSSPPPRTSPS